ncbi:Dihydroorotate dehydrogenase B (NAD(+)), electron transfer subunit [anaerobic digester metagenome]
MEELVSTTILKKRILIPGRVTEMTLDAPEIAAKAKPGNFVILRVAEDGERFPLTIADADAGKGTITIVYLVLGKSTAILDSLGEGDAVLDLCGPLGRATDIHKVGTVICVGGGTGIAAMHHIAKGHAQAGNKVVSVIGARSADLLLFEEELSKFSHEVLIATDDGSKGQKGFVTQVLKERLEADPDVKEVVAVGPVPMMRAVAEVTRPFGVKTVVSLNSIMVDGIGMCGACRVRVDDSIRFACVDGPEFDAHKVDFGELMMRLGSYVPQEKQSYKCYCECHGKES